MNAHVDCSVDTIHRVDAVMEGRCSLGIFAVHRMRLFAHRYLAGRGPGRGPRGVAWSGHQMGTQRGERSRRHSMCISREKRG